MQSRADTDAAAPAGPGLEEALETVRQQEELIQRLLMQTYEPVAVVGVGLRLPGGEAPLTSLGQFGEFLREGRSATGPPPPERRLTVPGQPVPDGGFLDRLDLFDARFFNISPKEARWIDPQQRLVLETSWEALESANIDPSALRGGNGGVYLGASAIDYAMELEAFSLEELDGHAAPGVMHAALCGRVSYFLGWRGPSLCVDTACSASLVALHQAVDGLRRGECDIALCGGVNAIHHPRSTSLFTDLEALSPHGRCKTFDEYADGYARGEGCAVVVLKRMSDARRDGDTILALVRGTAVGQDGESAGLYVPNGSAQEQVMRRALEAAALEPEDVQYVEAHGTGTPLGDPIEMGAINEVFRASHTAERPLAVGSHKTNIGHLEPAAGIVGVVKAVAQMQARALFPHLNLDTPSGRIPWSSYPVTVPTECRDWEGDPRRALVNSFGVTGTIASAVLEEPPEPPDADGTLETDGAGRAEGSEPSAHVFTLSAKSRKSLDVQIKRYQGFLAGNLGLEAGDICYTSNVARAHFPHRIAGLVRDGEELAELLAVRGPAVARGEAGERAAPRKVAFLFPGQGAQHVGMGSVLYGRHPEFRRTVDRCDELFRPYLGRSVRELMFGQCADAEREIDRTRHTQPALFVLEYALARLWLSWGVRPGVMLGHSIGELTAATVAGLFELPDAVRLVAARARLMDAVTEPGGMAAVQAPVEEVAELVREYGDLAVAADNSPTQCVVSGGGGSLAELVAKLQAGGTRVRRLPVSQGFHSPLMAPAAEEFRAELDQVTFHEPQLVFISNLTGQPARWRRISTSDYWARLLTEPVAFRPGARSVERRGPHVFVELGPSGTLSGLAKRSVTARDHVWVSSLAPTAEDDSTLLRSLTRVYEAGIPLSWRDFHGASARRKVDLPRYAFDRKPYWLPVPERAGRAPVDSRPAPGAAAEAEDSGPAAASPAAASPAPASPAAAGTGTSAGSCAPAVPDPERLRELEPAERAALLREFVRGLLAEALDFDDPDEVGPEVTFAELGLDSLAATALCDRLAETVRVEVPVSEVFDHPTARRFAEVVDQRLTAVPTAPSA